MKIIVCFKVGESKKAAQAASTFLFLIPDHEDMAANLAYYTQVTFFIFGKSFFLSQAWGYDC